MYHVPLAFPCVYGRDNEKSENEDGENGSENFTVGETTEIDCFLVYDLLLLAEDLRMIGIFLKYVKKGSEGECR